MSKSPAAFAVLFDIDGTLLDTREFISGAFEHNWRLHNIDFEQARERWAAVAGLDLALIYSHLCPEIDSAMLCASHRQFQMDNMQLVKVFPGVRELLVSLREKGASLAAVTSRNRGTVILSLELHLLHDLFDYIVCADEVTFVKPHPEPILAALRHFDAGADSAIMVGDSRVDVQAGKAAGTKTVGVSYGFEGSAIAHSEPDFIASTVEELNAVLCDWMQAER